MLPFGTHCRQWVLFLSLGLSSTCRKEIHHKSDLTVQQEMRDFGGGAAAVFMFQVLCAEL